MTHLTEIQILAYVDGSADYMTQAICTNHLATCELCRREVDLHKGIVKVGKVAGLMMPSRGFTRKVLSQIVPSRTRLASRWVLNNMGGMFAMMAVAGVTGAVVWGEQSADGSEFRFPEIDLSTGVQRVGGMWKEVSGVMGEGLSFLRLPPISTEGNLVLIVASVLALVLLDRFFKTRFLHTTRH